MRKEETSRQSKMFSLPVENLFWGGRYWPPMLAKYGTTSATPPWVWWPTCDRDAMAPSRIKHKGKCTCHTFKAAIEWSTTRGQESEVLASFSQFLRIAASEIKWSLSSAKFNLSFCFGACCARNYKARWWHLPKYATILMEGLSNERQRFVHFWRLLWSLFQKSAFSNFNAKRLYNFNGMWECAEAPIFKPAYLVMHLLL